MNFLLLQNAPAQAADPMTSLYIPLIIMVGILWFMMIQPQRKQRKKDEAMRSALKKGDRVITTSLIEARVQQVKEDVIVLDLDGESRMTVRKAAIATVIDDGAPAKSAVADAKT